MFPTSIVPPLGPSVRKMSIVYPRSVDIHIVSSKGKALS